jgi:hypothetical protein
MTQQDKPTNGQTPQDEECCQGQDEDKETGEQASDKCNCEHKTATSSQEIETKEIYAQKTSGNKAKFEAPEETKNERVMQDDGQESNWPCKEV